MVVVTGRRFQELLPTRTRPSFLLQRVWTGCGVYPGSQQMDILSPLPGIKWPGLDSKYIPIERRSREYVQIYLHSVLDVGRSVHHHRIQTTTNNAATTTLQGKTIGC
jgi:hypothetical protein